MTADSHNNHLESIDQPTVHHEETDVNIRAIFGFGAALLLVAVVIHAAMWGLFVYFNGRQARENGPSSPLTTAEPRLPPEPRLQVSPREDAAVFHAEEEAILNGYTWVNRETGTVRIPVADAMRMTVQKGLPTRPPPQQGQR
jgi:hypothetical protein